MAVNKKRKSSTTTKPKTKTSKKQEAVEIVNDDSEIEEVPAPAKKKAKTSPKAAKSAKKKAATEPVDAQSDLKSEFEQARLEKLFAKYADPEEKDMIMTEGMVNMFSDGGIDLDGALPFALAYDLQAEQMGTFRKSEYLKLKSARVDNLGKLKRHLTDTASVLLQSEAHFDLFYKFLFKYCLDPGQKSMPMEMAQGVWSFLLPERGPLGKDFLDFLQANPYKGVTKDVWTSLLEFTKEVQLKEDGLEGYSEEDSSWPTILDDYAAWVKRGRPSKTTEES